ncbi:hypothetical protein [Paenibacillus gorillae]|uniref:hypothetical protein n=1 Tax=Paenibacillus gorillae TaxID=1243662 RepID=UPI0004B2A823|nr:hypothetical protein [Paenibacillus gorillae]
MSRAVKNIKTALKVTLDNQYPLTSFEQVWDASKINKKSIRTKKLMMISVLTAVLLVTAAFSYKIIFWGNTEIIISNSDEDLAQMVTPLESINHIINDSKNLNFTESQKRVAFKILQSGAVQSWTQINSVGIIQPQYDNNSISDGPLVYFDQFVSSDSQDEKVVVSQRYDAITTEALKKKENESFQQEYPKGAKIISEFGSDFAVLINLQKGRYQLGIIHVDDNGIAMRIDLWGNTDPNNLVKIAHLYLLQS